METSPIDERFVSRMNRCVQAVGFYLPLLAIFQVKSKTQMDSFIENTLLLFRESVGPAIGCCESMKFVSKKPASKQTLLGTANTV